MSNKSLTVVTNRQNAQHSTGPRTEAGKRTSSLNSLRHGLTGSFVLLPSEDPEAYRLFVKHMKDDLRAEGTLEIQFAQTMADTQWRINRVPSLEAGLYESTEGGATENSAGPDLVDRQFMRLQLLGLYEQRLQRILQNTLKQLRVNQAARRALVKAETSCAGQIRTLLISRGLPFHPDEFGFASSASQLDKAIRFEEAMCGPRRPATGIYTPPDPPMNVA